MAKDKRAKRSQKKQEKAAWARHKREKQLDAKFERLPLQMVREKVQERPCGGCTACCTAIAVHELEKPVWTTCQHQCAAGCSIYQERPESCRTYYCLWQAGFLKDEENRPDKLGIIFDYRSLGTVDGISAWEIREGAADDPKVKQLIQDMLDQVGRKVIVCIRRYRSNKRRFIGAATLLNGLNYTELT